MKIIIETEIISVNLDGDACILNVKTGKYFNMNGTGTRIWELLNEFEDTEKAFDVFSEEYAADYNILQRDFSRIIDKLIESKLVHLQ